VIALLAGEVTADFVNGDLVIVGQVNGCDTGASPANTYACTIVPNIAQWNAGTAFLFKVSAANTGASTFTPTSGTLTPKTIVKVSGGITTALVANDLRAGQYALVVYDGTNLQLVSQQGTELSGEVTSVGRVATTVATKLRTRTCMMVVGTDNGTALLDADLGPQLHQCTIDVQMTVQEIRVSADAGTPSLIVQKRTVAGAPSPLLTGALATAASGGVACSKTSATTSYDGTTTCSATLQNNTALTPGMTLGLTSGTAGGVAKRVSVAVTLTID